MPDRNLLSEVVLDYDDLRTQLNTLEPHMPYNTRDYVAATLLLAREVKWLRQHIEGTDQT